jgi:DNA-directed RNA polymerase beta' subunit
MKNINFNIENEFTICIYSQHDDMDCKRKLTMEEINDILDIVIIHNGSNSLSKRTKDSIINGIKNKLLVQLESIEIYPSNVGLLKENIKKSYYKSQVSYGEPIGVIMGQSLGEKQTQSTLNSFHAAGISLRLLVTGVPRFIELISAAKDPKGVSCKMVLDGSYTSTDVRNYISHSLTQLNTQDIIDGWSIKDTLPKWWNLYINEFDDVNVDVVLDKFISLKINKSILFKYRLDLNNIKSVIENTFTDVYVVPSPVGFLEVLIFPKTTTTLPESMNVEDYLSNTIFPEVEKLQIYGIQNIYDYIFTKCDDEWIIETEGSNFKELLGLGLFDYKSIISNNMWDIYNVLGIEATRQFLFDEFCNVLNSDGAFINHRHVDILVDIMTFKGFIISFSRYGSRYNPSPLSRVSFEETLDNLIRAATNHEFESTKSISSSVMIGKIPNIGTSLCDLVNVNPFF